MNAKGIMKKEIFLLSNIAPVYRKSLWLKLLENDYFNCFIAYGENKSIGIPQIPLKDLVSVNSVNRIYKVKNIWYKGIVLFWQSGAFRLISKNEYSAFIFLGDFWCISTWLLAALGRLRGVKVVFWGHGLYGDESKLKLFFRLLFYRLATHHLLYERRAKKLMIAHGFKSEQLYVVFNSLDYDLNKSLRDQGHTITKEIVCHFFKEPLLPLLIFVGRLTIVKKINLLIDAAIILNNEKTIVNVLIVGDGPLRSTLEKYGQNGINNKWLHFVGSCYLEKDVSKYLTVADLCVSPGNVGLTAIHSLSYGTPVCSHDNLNSQMPEVEAIEEGVTGFYFKENNIYDLVFNIKHWLSENTERDSVRTRCFDVIDKYYNPDYQLEVFNRMLNNKVPEI